MTDKPDVAALVARLQKHAKRMSVLGRTTWSAADSEAASELTRLAAENRTYAEAHAYNSARFAEMLSERDAAKAEIAHWQYLAEEWERQCDIACARADEWEANHDTREGQLSEAKAEIARLTAERDEWQRQHDLKDHRCFALAQRAENAEAEVARLRALLEPFAESAAHYEIFGIYGGVPVRHLRDARAALKPDTGEKP